MHPFNFRIFAYQPQIQGTIGACNLLVKHINVCVHMKLILKGISRKSWDLDENGRAGVCPKSP